MKQLALMLLGILAPFSILLSQQFTDTVVLYQRAGFDDVIVVNAPASLSDAPDLALQNNGEMVFFTLQPDGTLALDTIELFVSDLLSVQDFDNDGLLDLLSRRGLVNYGMANETFSSSEVLGFLSSERARFYVDVNGDDLLDIFTHINGGFGESDLLRLWLSQPDSSYQVDTLIEDAFRLECSAVGDVNQDGFMDYCLIEFYDALVDDDFITYLGDGNGNFTVEVTSSDLLGGDFITLADLNGDDFPEAIFDRTLFPGLYYLRNQGGSLASAEAIVVESDSYNYKHVIATDFDADGDNDLVAFAQLGFEDEDLILTLENDGAGNFGAPVVIANFDGFDIVGIPDNQGYSLVAAKDLNGDFLPDILVNNDRDRETYVLYNTMVSGVRTWVPGAIEQLDVYPNPVGYEGSLRINESAEFLTSIRELIIYDVNGRMISQDYHPGDTAVDVSHLKPGMYTLVVCTQNGDIRRSTFLR